jgi:anti-sigma B factor antagonist
MSFQVSQRTSGEVLILALEGRFVIGDALETFRERIDVSVKAGNKRIALDFSSTDYIDSSGMGYLVVAHKVCLDAGGALTMFNLTDRVVDLMLLTKLSDVFGLYASEADAVAGALGEPGAERLDLIAYVQAQGEHAPGGE